MPVKNILKISGDSISLSKRGQTSTDMFLKKDTTILDFMKPHMVHYRQGL